MQIYFAIPPNSALHGLLEEFFFYVSKIQNIGLVDKIHDEMMGKIH